MKNYYNVSGTNQQTFSLEVSGPKHEPKVLWTLKNFEATSSPFLNGGILYISQNEQLLAVNAASGETKWKKKTPAQVTAPTIAGDLLLVGGHYIDNYLYGIDKNTGEEKFKYRTGPSNAGVHSPPIVEDSKIIFAAGKTIHALDLNDQKPRWKYKTGDKVDYNAVTAGDGNIYKSTLSATRRSKIIGMAIGDGSEICQVKLDTLCTSSLLYHEKHILFTDFENQLNILNPASGALHKFKIVEGKSPQSRSFLALKAENLIIAIGNTLASLNLNTWQWNWTMDSKGSIGQPVIADEMVYFATCFDGIYALALNTGHRIFHINTEVRSLYSCGIEDEILVMAGSMNEHELITYGN